MALAKTTSTASGICSSSSSSSTSTSICIRVDEMGMVMMIRVMNVLELEGKMVFWRRRRGMNMMAKEKVDLVAYEGSLVGEV